MLLAFSIEFIRETLPGLLPAAWLTVQLSAIGIAGGVAGGVLVAGVHALGNRFVNKVILAYVEFIRNTPFVGHIFFLFFGLPVLGVTLSPFTIGWLSLILWGVGYSAENFRAGFEAVPKSYTDGARALGFRGRDIVVRVLMPVGFRIAFPAAGNTAIAILKNSSYLMLIAVPELTYAAISIVNLSFRAFEMFFVMGVFYLALVGALSAAMVAAERWLAVEQRT